MKKKNFINYVAFIKMSIMLDIPYSKLYEISNDIFFKNGLYKITPLSRRIIKLEALSLRDKLNAKFTKEEIRAFVNKWYNSLRVSMESEELLKKRLENAKKYFLNEI